MWPSQQEYAQACSELDYYTLVATLGFAVDDHAACGGQGCEDCRYAGQVEYSADDWFALTGYNDEYEHALVQVTFDYEVGRRLDYRDEDDR